MADNEEGEETVSRGNEWEVVSLTASAYAAAPGPREVKLKDDNKGDTYGEDEAETSRGLFMSGHFVFPPNQHGDLPLESKEIHNEHIEQDVVSEVGVEGGRSSGKDEAELNLKELNVSDEFLGRQFLDEMENKLSVHGREFGEPTTLEGLNLVDKEEMYNVAKFSSFHNETAISGLNAFGEDMTNPEIIEPSAQDLDFSAGISQSPRAKDDKDDGSDLPCEAWWKRRAASLYSHAKEANTFWSIFVAAAVMGLVILGKRWRQDRWQVMQLKWQSSISEEKMDRVIGPMIRYKDVMASTHHHGSFVRGGPSS